MSNQEQQADYSSVGHRLSNVSHLDAHYIFSQKSYEAMIHAVGLQKGWRVLDAGCGSGSFLPLIANSIGSKGKIDAYDLATENIERVRALVKEWNVPVETKIGDMTQLPYADNTFDAIWNANVTQYLGDEKLTQMLNEFVRVVKLGGLVAIKEFDDTTFNFFPFDTFVWWRFGEQLGKKTQDYSAQWLCHSD